VLALTHSPAKAGIAAFARLVPHAGLALLAGVAAGFLLESVSARTTVAVFAACGLVLAVWGTVSSSIRKVPSLDALSS
jgi:hypothetical protein